VSLTSRASLCQPILSPILSPLFENCDIPATLAVTRPKQICLHRLVRVVRTLDIRSVTSSCVFRRDHGRHKSSAHRSSESFKMRSRRRPASQLQMLVSVTLKDHDLNCIFSRIVWFGAEKEALPRIVELGPSPTFQPAAVISFSDVQNAVSLRADQFHSRPAQ
jgi:hypothetical protein